MACFCAAWAAGRLALGRWPGSSLDDPKQIEGSFMLLYEVTAVLVRFGVPLFGLALLILALVCLSRRQAGWKSRLVEIAITVVVFGGLMAFCQWDPQSVVEWFVD
jgi:hypothetical protein